MSKKNTFAKLKELPVIGMLFSNIGILSVLLIICAALAIAEPKSFLSSSNILSVLRQISNNMYIALGMTLVIIISGIDLSVGSVVCLSGTITVGLITLSGYPIWLAIIIGILLGALCGFCSGTIIAQFRVPAFIVTMAMMNIARGAANVYSGARSMRITDKVFETIGMGKLFGIPLPIIYMVILIAIVSFVLNKTKFGTYIYAIGGNRESARLSGVPIKKVEIAVYTIAGLLAAFAGVVLASRMYSAQPSVGEGFELDAIAACVLGGVSMSGGKGRISGTVLGAMVIGIISNGLNLLDVNSFWQLIVKGIIILIAVLIDTQKSSDSALKKLFGSVKRLSGKKNAA
jgi:ribose transport system permease protein